MLTIEQLRAAHTKLDLLMDRIFDREPGPEDVITAKERTALRIFELLFGHSYFGRGDLRNVAGLDVVETVQGKDINNLYATLPLLR